MELAIKTKSIPGVFGRLHLDTPWYIIRPIVCIGVDCIGIQVQTIDDKISQGQGRFLDSLREEIEILNQIKIVLMDISEQGR